MEPEDYVLNWRESDGKRTLCGPFSLSFAYMQGVARDSLVLPKSMPGSGKSLTATEGSTSIGTAFASSRTATPTMTGSTSN